MIFGAAIASKTHNYYLAAFLAFISHYFLDFLPHIEYDIDNIKEGGFKRALPDFLKVFLDLFFGIFLILFFYKDNPIIFIGALFAILPDCLAYLNYFRLIKNKILNAHDFFHHELIHCLRDKKISVYWRVATQIMIFVFSVVLLRS